MSTSTDIEARAAEWLAREDRGFGDADNRAFETWLQESSANRVAYLRLKATWSRAGRLAALRGSAPESPLPPIKASEAVSRPSSHGPIGRRIAAGIGAIAIAGAVLFATLDHAAGDHHQTQLGGREVVPLADGSRLELNTDTHVRTRLTLEERTVWLERGEAYFEVARDETRPFIVIAGDRRVTVLGTKFSVRRISDDVQVKVLEGRVKVEALDSKPAREAVAPAATLTAGQVGFAHGELTLVAQRDPQDIANDLAWRHGVLVMDQWTLGDAAREFNRYNRRQLVVEGAARDIRLGGTFESGNVEAFSRLLKDGFGLEIRSDENRIVVSN